MMGMGGLMAQAQQQQLYAAMLKAERDARAAFYKHKYGERFCGMEGTRPIVWSESQIPKVRKAVGE